MLRRMLLRTSKQLETTEENKEEGKEEPVKKKKAPRKTALQL